MVPAMGLEGAKTTYMYLSCTLEMTLSKFANLLLNLRVYATRGNLIPLN